MDSAAAMGVFESVCVVLLTCGVRCCILGGAYSLTPNEVADQKDLLRRCRLTRQIVFSPQFTETAIFW